MVGTKADAVAPLPEQGATQLADVVLSAHAHLGRRRITNVRPRRLGARALRRTQSGLRCQQRTTRQMELTEIGRRLLPLARELLEAEERLKAVVREPERATPFELDIGNGNIRRRLLDGKGRVAVLPKYFVRDDLKAKRLVRLLPTVALRSDSFRLVWRRDHPRGHEMLKLADELRGRPLQ